MVEAHRFSAALQVLNVSKRVMFERIRSEGRTSLAAALAMAREEMVRSRLNEDIHLRAIAAEGRVAIEKARQAISLLFTSLGYGLTAMLSDKQQLLRVVVSTVR